VIAQTCWAALAAFSFPASFHRFELQAGVRQPRGLVNRSLQLRAEGFQVHLIASGRDEADQSVSRVALAVVEAAVYDALDLGTQRQEEDARRYAGTYPNASLTCERTETTAV
jgi:hypothetical protein